MVVVLLVEVVLMLAFDVDADADADADAARKVCRRIRTGATFIAAIVAIVRRQ